MTDKPKKIKGDIDFLIALALVANQDSPYGVMKTIQTHVREWEKAGIIPLCCVPYPRGGRVENWIKEVKE